MEFVKGGKTEAENRKERMPRYLVVVITVEPIELIHLVIMDCPIMKTPRKEKAAHKHLCKLEAVRRCHPATGSRILVSISTPADSTVYSSLVHQVIETTNTLTMMVASDSFREQIADV